jgi:hypothetical protein
MAKRNRERIGPFVVTRASDLNPEGIDCQECGKLLARYDPATDLPIPSCEELHVAGAVPVPNFGWFCSQECGRRYTEKTGIRFDRDAEGSIRYY